MIEFVNHSEDASKWQLPFRELSIGTSAPVPRSHSRHPLSLLVHAIPTTWFSPQADPSSINSPMRRQRWCDHLLRRRSSHHSSSVKITNSESSNLVPRQAGALTTTSGTCSSFPVW